MKKPIVQYLVKCALCALAVFTVTFFTGSAFGLPQGAYLHLGDSALYILALLFPLGVSLPATVVGMTLADVALGSYNYMITTAIIKSLMVVSVKSLIKLSDKPLTQDVLVCLTGIVGVAGYFVTDVFITFSNGIGFIEAVLTEVFDSAASNVLQALACALVYLALSGIIRRLIDKKQKTETEVSK